MKAGTQTNGSKDHEGLSRQAFEILVREYHRRILAYALSLVGDVSVAEDLAQDAFVAAYQNLARFDTSRDFGAWVRGILRNKYREWARRRNVTTLDESMLEVLEARYHSWDDARRDDKEDALVALQACIDKLSDLLRKTVRFFYFDRSSCEAIARIMKTQEVTVRQRLYKGRQILADCVNRALQTDS
jgi:RNA polymerase sigma-70 factor (ECF subfamily)